MKIIELTAESMAHSNKPWSKLDILYIIPKEAVLSHKQLSDIVKIKNIKISSVDGHLQSSGSAHIDLSLCKISLVKIRSWKIFQDKDYQRNFSLFDVRNNERPFIEVNPYNFDQKPLIFWQNIEQQLSPNQTSSGFPWEELVIKT